jgi:hypothetical protein
MDKRHRLDLSIPVRVQPCLDDGGINPVTPVAGNEIDIETELQLI